MKGVLLISGMHVFIHAFKILLQLVLSLEMLKHIFISNYLIKTTLLPPEI